MAQLITFTTKHGKGFQIKDLPMPDGTYRTYRLIGQGRETLRKILKIWKFEYNIMLQQIV